ncbi:MAG: hypothetical protein HY756_07060 [Nitrospirae bacterium]|nr:hypothetical protein [Nitrospirota bacterium]
MINRIVPLIVLAIMLTPLYGQAGEIKGNIYISDYYSVDNGGSKFNVLSTRLNVEKPEPDTYGLYFKFDGRMKATTSNGDSSSNVSPKDIDEMWVAYKFLGRTIDISAGRQYIEEMFNTMIDGIDMKVRLKTAGSLGVGIFGGLAPDKYDNSFNSKFRSIGAYTFFESDKHQAYAGYENLMYNGKTDREYLSFRMMSMPIDKIRFNVISSASINQITKDVEMENASVNFMYSFSKDLQFNTYYNYYNTIKYYESSKAFLDESFSLDTNSQTSAGIRIDYRVTENLSIYAVSEYQWRETDGDKETRLTGGLRRQDLLGFDFSGRYTHITNSSTTSDEFNVELSRVFFEKLSTSIYASHEKQEVDDEGSFTTGLLTYGGSLFFPIGKGFYISMFIERYDETDFKSTSLFTQLGYKF